MNTDDILLLLAMTAFVGLYTAPTIIALKRHHRKKVTIAVVNIFLISGAGLLLGHHNKALFIGITVTAWLAALIWSFTSDVEKDSAPQTEEATADIKSKVIKFSWTEKERVKAGLTMHFEVNLGGWFIYFGCTWLIITVVALIYSQFKDSPMLLTDFFHANRLFTEGAAAIAATWFLVEAWCTFVVARRGYRSQLEVFTNVTWEITDEGLTFCGGENQSKFPWKSIKTVMLLGDFLFIFMQGGGPVPIPRRAFDDRGQAWWKIILEKSKKQSIGTG